MKTQKAPRRVAVGLGFDGPMVSGLRIMAAIPPGTFVLAGRPVVCSPGKARVCLHPRDKQGVRDEVIWWSRCAGAAALSGPGPMPHSGGWPGIGGHQ